MYVLKFCDCNWAKLESHLPSLSDSRFKNILTESNRPVEYVVVRMSAYLCL